MWVSRIWIIRVVVLQSWWRRMGGAMGIRRKGDWSLFWFGLLFWLWIVHCSTSLFRSYWDWNRRSWWRIRNGGQWSRFWMWFNDGVSVDRQSGWSSSGARIWRVMAVVWWDGVWSVRWKSSDGTEMRFRIHNKPWRYSSVGGQSWWMVWWQWDESMETPMGVWFMRRCCGKSFFKFNRGFEKGKQSRQVVEMHNSSGKMMMKSTSLCMVHGTRWAKDTEWNLVDLKTLQRGKHERRQATTKTKPQENQGDREKKTHTKSNKQSSRKRQ